MYTFDKKKQKAPKVVLTTLYFTTVRGKDGKLYTPMPECDMTSWQDSFTEKHLKQTADSLIDDHEQWIQERISYGDKRKDLYEVDYYTQKVVSA